MKEIDTLKDDFNLVKDALKLSIKVDKHLYILGKEGEYEFEEDYGWSCGQSYPFNKLSDRKRESERTLHATILLYDGSTESLFWKTCYRNTKGVYFNKDRKKYYLNV